jgi:hypothetical protein
MAQSRWAFVILLVAVLIVGVAFFESLSLKQVSYSIRPMLKISVFYNTTSVRFRNIVVANNVGAPGGIVLSSRYLSDGVNGYYPLSTRDYSGYIHVDSSVHRDYTLGDFFEVFGEPLGPLDTLGYHANVTARVPYTWSMCLIDPYLNGRPPAPPYPVDEWGSHVLRDNETITLIFANEPCA